MKNLIAMPLILISFMTFAAESNKPDAGNQLVDIYADVDYGPQAEMVLVGKTMNRQEFEKYYSNQIKNIFAVFCNEKRFNSANDKDTKADKTFCQGIANHPSVKLADQIQLVKKLNQHHCQRAFTSNNPQLKNCLSVPRQLSYGESQKLMKGRAPASTSTHDLHSMYPVWIPGFSSSLSVEEVGRISGADFPSDLFN